MEKQAVSRLDRDCLRRACFRVILVPALCIFGKMELEIRKIFLNGYHGFARRTLPFQKIKDLIGKNFKNHRVNDLT